MNKMTQIREDSFFNIEHPDNAFVEIKLKTMLGSSESNPREDDSLWESVTLENNFFDNITITDEGGFQKLELVLRDRDFVNLEDKIMRMIMCSRTQTWNTFYNEDKKIQAYELDENGKTKKDENGKPIPLNSYYIFEPSSGKKVAAMNIPDGASAQERTELALEKQFTFFINSNDANCIKVRFGHSLKSDVGINFVGRTKSKKGTVLMSPWIYFILLNVNYNINNDGSMSFLIEGISEGAAWFDRAKLMLNGSILKGTPERVWNLLSKYIAKGSNNKIILQKDGNSGGEQYEKKAQDFFKYQNKRKEIKLSTLYEEVKTVISPQGLEERVLSFKPLKQLLNDFVNLCKPMYRSKEGKIIVFDDSEKEEDIQNNIHHMDKPRWTYFTYNPKGDSTIGSKNDSQIIIKLYYSSPIDNNPQEVERIYSWKDAPKSLIKNFSVATKNDFAMLNAPVSLMKGGEVTNVNLGSISYSTQREYENRVNLVNTIRNGLKERKWTGGFLSAEAFKTTNYNDDTNFLGSLIDNINNAVFTGELEIPLDPFYLFDDEMLPYTYMIRLDINRPTRFNRNNEVVTPYKSYLTGNYLISKIVHTISYGSATTKLSITRFPDIDENYDANSEEVVYSGVVIRESVKKVLDSTEEQLKTFDEKIQNLVIEYNKVKKERDRAYDSWRKSQGSAEEKGFSKEFSDKVNKLNSIIRQLEDKLDELNNAKNVIQNLSGNMEI